MSSLWPFRTWLTDLSWHRFNPYFKCDIFRNTHSTVATPSSSRK